MGLDCSHLFSRSNRATRWHPDNAFSHCTGCHSKLGGNPVEFYLWAYGRLGEPRLTTLRRDASRVRKWSLTELQELYQHYQDEYQRLKELRAKGEIGRIEFHAREFFEYEV